MRPARRARSGLDVDGGGRGDHRGRHRQHVRGVHQRAGPPRARSARLHPGRLRRRRPGRGLLPRRGVPHPARDRAAVAGHALRAGRDERRRQERLRQDAPPPAVGDVRTSCSPPSAPSCRRAPRRWLAEEAPAVVVERALASAPTCATWARPSRSRCRSTRLARGRDHRPAAGGLPRPPRAAVRARRPRGRRRADRPARHDHRAHAQARAPGGAGRPRAGDAGRPPRDPLPGAAPRRRRLRPARPPRRASTSPGRPSSSRTTRPRWSRPASAPTVDAFGNSRRSRAARSHGDRPRHARDPAQPLPGRSSRTWRGSWSAPPTRRSSRRRPTSRPGSSSTGGEYVAYPWKLGRLVVPRPQHEARPSTTSTATTRATSSSATTPTSSGPLCTHLPDVHILRPIFHGGRIICWGYAFVHSSDIGGTVPASVWPRATEIFQEGLRLRPTKLYRAGVLQRGRQEPDRRQLPHPRHELGRHQGDGARRSTRATGASRRWWRSSGSRRWWRGSTRSSTTPSSGRARRSGKIPDGTYRFTDYMEDDLRSRGADPHRGRADRRRATRSTSTSRAPTRRSGSALNIASHGVTHPFMCQAINAYIVTEDPDIPKASSILRPVRVTAPPGTVVNASVPGADRRALRDRAPRVRRGPGRPGPGAARPGAGGAGRARSRRWWPRSWIP